MRPFIMRKPRTKYLSYIEETFKHKSVLMALFAKATKQAIEEAKKNDLAVTYAEGINIIEESPSGEKSIVGSIVPSRIYKKGERLKLR